MLLEDEDDYCIITTTTHSSTSNSSSNNNSRSNSNNINNKNRGAINMSNLKRSSSFYNSNKNLSYPTLRHCSVTVAHHLGGGGGGGGGGGDNDSELLTLTEMPPALAYDCREEQLALCQVDDWRTRIAELSKKKDEDVKRRQEEQWAELEARKVRQEEEKRLLEVQLANEAMDNIKAQSLRQLSANQDLTPQQMASVSTFQSISSCDSVPKCRQFLELFDFDISKATNALFEQGGDIDSALQKKMPAPIPPQPPQANTLLQITLPSGTVVSESFSLADTLWSLYQFVAARGESWGHRQFYLKKQNGDACFTEPMLNLTFLQAGFLPFDAVTVSLSAS